MTRLLRTCVLAALCLFSASAAWAQATTLVVHRNANLREEASTQSDILDHLEPGDELVLLSPTKTAGFYHARTADGTEGWVYQTLVHVDDEDLVAPAFAVTGVVRGPVLGAPCIRHRPFGIAGPWQGVPRRVLAPHRGAFSGSPGELPFFNQPRRGA